MIYRYVIYHIPIMLPCSFCPPTEPPSAQCIPQGGLLGRVKHDYRGYRTGYTWP